MISRRQFLYFSAGIPLYCPVARLARAAVSQEKATGDHYPVTLEALYTAYWAEVTASRHYAGYCRKALVENYPNIAYLFFALSHSEKIHADNYRAVIVSLGSSPRTREIPVTVDDTRANLNRAVMNELEKISTFYPDILQTLSSEAHDQAVMCCMYSWKSHKQHEQIIKEIGRYSGMFFEPLAEEIERMDPDFYVCEICGSTVDEQPEAPCEICNRPRNHYKRLERPHA